MPKQQTPAVQSGAAPVSAGNGQKQSISFRFGTLERGTPLSQLGPFWGATNGISASSINIGGQIQGDGYLASLRLETLLSGGTGATTAAVGFEDAPWSLFDTVGLKDSRADLISSMNGFHLFLANLLQSNYRNVPTMASLQQTIMGEPIAIAGSDTFSNFDANGNAHFMLDVPVVLNNKTLAALVGNQDANSRYTLNLILASGSGSTAGPVFSTAPSGGTAPAITVNPSYRSFQVPPATIGGTPVQQTPPGYGKLHLVNATQPQNAPANGGNISHFLSLNKVTIRALAFAFRSVLTSGAALRSNCEAAVPTVLRLYWGATETFEESWAVRRSVMFERFGFEFPLGVVVYDGMSDMLPGSGVESGASYIDTRALTSAKLQVSYPTTSGQWAPGSTLTVIQDALQVVTPG